MPADEMIGSDRPVRTCIGCGITDDHPRCVVDVGDGEVNWHMDCHLIAHGPLPCHHLVEGNDGPKGAELLDHILDNDGS